jgi:hypothetical protein
MGGAARPGFAGGGMKIAQLCAVDFTLYHFILPLMRAMRERYPDVRLHLVESLSGHRASPKRTSRWRRWPTHTCAVATCSPACRTMNSRRPPWPRAW